jgi:hypothetical protein
MKHAVLLAMYLMHCRAYQLPINLITLRGFFAELTLAVIWENKGAQ